MKARFILFIRADVYCEDAVKRKQTSLRSKNKAEEIANFRSQTWGL